MEKEPLWYLITIAAIGSLPATLTALAGLVYAWKIKGEIKHEVKTGQDKIEAKVDAVKQEVDGKHTKLIEAIQNIATKAINPEPRAGRKTDPIIPIDTEITKPDNSETNIRNTKTD